MDTEETHERSYTSRENFVNGMVVDATEKAEDT